MSSPGSESIPSISKDEGEVQYVITAIPEQQSVLIDFGKPIRLLNMTAFQATDFCERLAGKVFDCRGLEG